MPNDLGAVVPPFAKRYLVQAAAHNLALLMRKLFKVGKPRCLQDGGRGLLARLVALWHLRQASPGKGDAM